MEIFKLFGSIMVDSSEAQKSISSTTEKTETLGQKLSNGIKTVAKWGTAVVGAATAVGGAMVAAAKDTAAELDVIDKASIRMGIAAESYQELAYAANLSGVEMSVMEKAAKKLEGTDLNLDDALQQIMSITDETERTNAAIEMFGQNIAYQMTPLLAAGTDGLADMRKEANDLGLVMSQDSVTAGAAMGDMFTKIGESMSALKNSLMAEFMPYIMEILQWVIDMIPVVRDAVKRFLDWIMPYLKPILEGVMAFIKGVFALINGDFSGFKDGVVTLLKNLATAMVQLGKNILNGLWDGIKSVWASIWNWVNEKVAWLKDKLTFWKNGNASMQTDGSHAAGLNYVPYDGYIAELHRGEMVLNASNTQSLKDDLVEGLKEILQGGNFGNGTIIVQSVLDGRVIGETSYEYNQNKARMYGI